MSRILDPGRQFEDDNGDPATSGTVTFYTSGTTTLKATYADSALASQNPNPITLGADGRIGTDCWGLAGTYTVRVADVNGNTIWSEDDIPGTGAVDAADLTYTEGDSNSVERTVESRLQDAVSIHDFGAVGDGTTDDTSAFDSALATGRVVQLKGGKNYLITRLISLFSGGGIVGYGATITLSTAFNNTLITAAGLVGNNAVGLYGSGVNRILLEGFKLTKTTLDGVIVSGITLRNCDYCIVKSVEVTNFSKAYGVIHLSSCEDCIVVDNNIHDCTTNDSVTGRISGIEIDSNLVSSAVSKRLRIVDNSIESLTIGATFLAAFGYLSYGVYVAVELSVGHTISNNTIDLAGRGIKTLGLEGTITGNVIRDAYKYGIALMDGASDNVVSGNQINRAGSAGVYLFGSNSASIPTDRNTITGNAILNTNNAANDATGKTAGVVLDDAGLSKLVTNTLVSDNYLDGDDGVVTDYGIYDTTTGSGNKYYNNISTRFSILPYSAAELTVAAGVVTIRSDYHTLDTESDAATDDIDTINGGWDGCVLKVKSANSARDIVLKDGTGNLNLSGDVTLATTDDTCTLVYDAGDLVWREVSRSASSTNFESAETTIALTGALPHGLGSVPKKFSVLLRCKTSDAASFAVGDEVPTSAFFISGTVPPVSGANATNIFWVLPSAVSLTIRNKSTGIATAITIGSWKIVCRGEN